MATAGAKTLCVTCNKDRVTFPCSGCQQHFCLNHLTEHNKELATQLDEIEDQRNIFKQTLSEHNSNPQKHILFKEISKWEENSIQKIKQTANELRETLIKHTNDHIQNIEIDLKKLTENIKEIRSENDFNENHLNELKTKLNKLEEQFNRPKNIQIKQDSNSNFINKIYLMISSTNSKFIFITLF